MATTATSLARETQPVALLASVPANLTAWIEAPRLLRLVQTAAVPGSGGSWLNLVADAAPAQPADDLLTLVAYCYLQGIFHSFDVVRQLDEDGLLAELRDRLGLRPEQVRRFRRDRRRALTDCLTRALVAVWRERHPTSGSGSFTASRQPDFAFLEPFYLLAQDRVDRAVVLDSMALDF